MSLQPKLIDRGDFWRPLVYDPLPTPKHPSASSSLTASVATSVIDEAILASSVYSDNAQANGFQLASLVMKNVPGFVPVVSLGNGFYANVFQRVVEINGLKTVELVVAFRGTDPTSLIDWATNFNQILDSALTTDQYSAAIQMVSDVTLAAVKLRRQGMDVTVTVTGHSLGGALAQFSSAMSDGLVDNVITFNSAGLSASSLSQIGSSKLASFEEINVTHLVTSGDLVHIPGTQLPGNVYKVEIPPPPSNTGLALIPLYYHSLPNLIDGIKRLLPPALSSEN